jgi:outer membrane protein assembly factor BamA
MQFLSKRLIGRAGIYVFFILLLVQLISSCGPARHLEGNEKLLSKIEFENEGELKYKQELLSLSKQRLNRKLLGLFKIYLGVYNLYYHKEDSKLKKNLGEAPVIYDSTLDITSTELMEKYLNNRGYYDNQVRATTRMKKKKAILTYHIDKGERYMVGEMNFDIPDPRLRTIYLQDTSNKLIGVGKPFDLELMQKERSRVEDLMKNHGYFEFSREYVLFEADTFVDIKKAHLTLSIKNPEVPFAATDSLVESEHQLYHISEVYIRLNHNEVVNSKLLTDTTGINQHLVVHPLDPAIKPEILSRAVYLKPGQLYSLQKQESSYRKLSSLGVFSFVSIKYERDYASADNQLQVFIDLNMSKQKSYTILAEGTNNGGNLGVIGDISFLNKNSFNGAEAVNLRLKGGLEVQQLLTNQEEDDNNVVDGFLPFNTIEFGPELNINIPRFLLPFDKNKFSPKGNPTTTIGFSYNFQKRPDYTRYVTKTYLSYSWNESITKTHIIYPFDLSFISLDPSDEFRRLLRNIRNPFLRNSYTDNLILGLKYSFILNTQLKPDKRNDFFFRINFEPAGHLLSALTNENNADVNEDGTINVVGIRFAQYVRSDFDFRYYQNFPYNQVVYRFAAGLGIPHGNSEALPFEKSFFAGGANGIRAWLARELGPGTLPDSLLGNVDQIGNLSLESNIEFRFPITKVFEGAAFADLGNIWNYRQDDSREETRFEAGNIWPGTAIGLGLGLRLNFTFFILRLDFATPFKDPSSAQPTLLKLRYRQTNLNFGIGYPF